MKKLVISGLVSLLLVGAIGYGIYKLPFVLGSWGNKVEEQVGTEYKNIKREQFESTKSYVHGKVEDLQRYKRELDKTKDIIERSALIIHIQDEFASFDESKINNQNLREFLNDIRNGVIE
ncbi:MAG: hypothetical protein ACRCVJ_18615 [Clostridium sp.]|uniref:hypothetical protein n=1 Tax=Clostridium sp. TaxID=1506 RepID=UPI003F3A22AE